MLSTTTGYQTRAFLEAAQKLGLGVTFGTDRCHVLEDPWQDGALPLRFEDPEASARQIVDYAQGKPVHAVVSLGDRPTPTAARAAQRLGLPFHPPQAADICRDKYLSRQRLRCAGLNVPAAQRYRVESDPEQILATHGVRFPCVLKPLALSASRGVIRADGDSEFVRAFRRIRELLRAPDVRVMRESSNEFIQVEDYIEGDEVAVEAVADHGQLRVLALFEKPDPLAGPFFEETLYVTPSRLAPEVQDAVTETLRRAAEALGLFHGPLHAEFRIMPQSAFNAASPHERVWILEVASRPIGGLCSRALRFYSPENTKEHITLEELIIRLALDESVAAFAREPQASGVMMIPIPAEGVYEGVEGVEQALNTPGVWDVVISAKPLQKLVPLPEGSSYLGFIFARGESPQAVEQALRTAHGKLRFTVSPALPVLR